jgi:hypothetical protein
MKVQITKIKFDLDSTDIEQQPNLQESLQEEYVGKVLNLDMSHYGTGGWDDEDVEEQLTEEITCHTGLLINYVNYNYLDENL